MIRKKIGVKEAHEKRTTFALKSMFNVKKAFQWGL